MDFFTLLKQEHKEAKDTFKELLAEETVDREQTEILCRKLLLHMEMEEKYFYPEMKAQKQKEAIDLATEALLEHTEARKPIKALIDSKFDDIEYKVKLELLQLEIVHHAEEEEKEFFPLAKELLEKEKIQEITDNMLALKEKKQVAV